MTHWREQAACVDSDPELWFPLSEGRVFEKETLAAKRICAQCPVKLQCLDEAMPVTWLAGIWGGTTERERRALRDWETKHARIS